MCGIAGAFCFGPNGPPPDQAIVSRLTTLLHRRGPDGAGMWSSDDGRVVLGHRRLAIIDIGAQGAQPMRDSTARWVISFNGEIYNYRDLRRELERDGCAFQTNSDTEVLIQAVAQWGVAGLRRLRGMYAFALWDRQQKELWLARDPYGIKPLYVGQTSDSLWFASQARVLASAAPLDHRRDPAGLTGFYLWGHVPEPFTWWQGIRMFPAGHVQRIGMDQTPPAPVPFYSIQQAYTAGVARPLEANELREALVESVKYHLVADVPVGIFLSAGVDSGVITALAAESGATLKTVTLAFDEYIGTLNDEAPLAESVAKTLKTEHSTIRIRRNEFEGVLGDFLQTMDQPSIDGLNTYLVSYAAARNGLKVALSGLGGDELFGGYPAFWQVPNLQRWRRHLPRSETLGSLLTAVAQLMPGVGISQKLPGLAVHGGDLASAYFLRRALYIESELDELLDESWITEGLRKLLTIPSLKKTIAALADLGAREHAQIAALESCWYMRNQLLRDTDWSSMAHGLEVRVPLVDSALLERIGPAINSAKPPTKNDLALSSPLFPHEMAGRTKTGFTTPIAGWIAQQSGKSERGLRAWATDVHRNFRAMMHTNSAEFLNSEAA